MEQNQHNNKEQSEAQSQPSVREAPGQKLPASDNRNTTSGTDARDTKEQHSESSMPQSDNETLGTP